MATSAWQEHMKDMGIRLIWLAIALFIIWEVVTAVASKQQ